MNLTNKSYFYLLRLVKLEKQGCFPPFFHLSKNVLASGLKVIGICIHEMSKKLQKCKMAADGG